MMMYIGIDPGKKGGIGVINGTDILTVPYSDENLIALLGEASRTESKVAVEQVHAMPGQGVTSMFTFGKGFGYILGVLEAFKVPYELIPPQKWKKVFSVTSDKNSSIEACKRLFPLVDLKPTHRCKKDNDGMAEALLLAEYSRRVMQ